MGFWAELEELEEEEEEEERQEPRAGFRLARRTGIRMEIRAPNTIAYTGRSSRFRCGT
jgi:hypothetical protein